MTRALYLYKVQLVTINILKCREFWEQIVCLYVYYNMLKRITSISIVLIMAISMAAPILHLDCDMPCCEVQEMTCCDKKMDTEITKACKVEMKTCDMGSIFVPLISAPLNKYNMKVEMNVQGTMQFSTFISSYNTNYNLVLLVHPPEPPLAFNSPLLV